MKPEEFETIMYQKKEGIAYITLNRPHVMNALNARMADELSFVWDDIRDDMHVKVVILTGAGEAFQQGKGDIEALKRSLEIDPASIPPTRPYRYSFNNPVTPKGHEVFKPIIVAVNGICGTSGMEQVAEGDIIICSENATFFDNHVSYGAIVHSAVNLAKKMPYNHVVRMALMGEHEVIDAKRAYEIGLVSEVTEREQLIPRATEIARTIMLNSPTAVQASLEIMWHSLSLGLRDAMQLDSYMQRYYNTHPDLREWIKATIENRRPEWKEAYWYDAMYHKEEQQEKTS